MSDVMLFIYRSNFCSGLRPKYRVNPKLINRANHTADVVAEDFRENFVFHGHVRLAANVIAKLGFNHHDRRFNVAALVVVREELLAVEGEVVKHLFPSAASVSACRVLFERDVRGCIDGHHRIEVIHAGIPLVRQDLVDLEVSCGVGNQGRQERGIASMLPLNVDRSNDIGFYAAHDMGLDPIVFLFNDSVFLVKPASESRSHKACRIHGEIGLNRLERQCTLRDQLLENGHQFWIFKVIENAVVMRDVLNEPLIFGIPKVAHESTARECGIDFEGGCEYGIRQREARSAFSLWRLCKARAQFVQQRLKLNLLLGLGLVVRRPVLGVGLALRFRDLQSLRHRRRTIALATELKNVFLSEYVLALAAMRLVIRAGAAPGFRFRIDRIAAIPALGRNLPNPVLLADVAPIGNLKPALLSRFHDCTPYLLVYYQ